MSWPPSNQLAASPIWISPSLLLFSSRICPDTILFYWRLVIMHVALLWGWLTLYIYTYLYTYIYIYAPILLEGCTLHLHGFISGNLLPSSPPSATIEAIEAIEPHDEDREGKPVLHIPPLSTHHHRDRRAHTRLIHNNNIAHEECRWMHIDESLQYPSEHNHLRRWRSLQGRGPPKGDDIKTLIWETAHFNALRFTLKDELKQFRGELSIRCWLSPPPTACCSRPPAKQNLKMEEDAESTTDWGYANRQMLRKVEVPHVGLVYLCFPGSSNGPPNILNSVAWTKTRRRASALNMHLSVSVPHDLFEVVVAN